MDFEKYYDGVPETMSDEVLDLVERNKSDFVVWDNYHDSDTAMSSFFWNYKTDDSYIALNDENDIIGLGCFDPRCDREDIPIEESTFSYLSLIMVDENYRGRGIGEVIFDKMASDCLDQGLSPMVLCTWEGNQAMIGMMEKKSFKIFSVKKNHRYNGQDSLYFRKDFEINSN